VFQPDPTADIEAFKAELKVVLDTTDQDGGMADNRITAQMVRGMRAGARYHLRAQSDLFLVVRNLTIVEGIVLRYCPTMDSPAEVRTITGAIMRRRLFGPGMLDEFTQLVPQLMLTFSQRPRLAARLLKLERSFNEAKTLGAFLRHEDVLQAQPQAPHPAWFALVAVVALGVGVLIGLAI
jgi:predicted unusual protein kinase regulating ubiquinone biosynthesis (AarF/ABC1/UbiB family)